MIQISPITKKPIIDVGIELKKKKSIEKSS
jgi:hypothetical protein